MGKTISRKAAPSADKIETALRYRKRLQEAEAQAPEPVRVNVGMGYSLPIRSVRAMVALWEMDGVYAYAAREGYDGP